MKFKKFISLLTSMAMMVTALTGVMTASASEVANGTCGDLTWTLDSDGKLTISGEGEMASAPTYDASDVVKAPVIEDYESVYTYKKEHKEDIKEVVIEEGVTSIGYCAFYKMPNLETVVLPSTIKKFNGSIWGRSVDGIRYSYAFAECTSLRNVTLAEGMTALGGAAFEGCTSLESVKIPSTLIRDSSIGHHPGNCDSDWGDYTFRNCTSLKNITLPEGLSLIGIGAFINTGVESVVIPSTIERWDMLSGNNGSSYENLAFQGCQKLSSVTLKEGIKVIQNSPFQGCPMLKKIVIPASVTNLNYAFSASGDFNNSPAKQQSYFEEVAFAEGSQITEISANAFFGCTNLKVLEIPENVVSYSVNTPFASASIENVYLYSENKSSSDGLSLNNVKKVYCFKDTEVYDKLLNEQHIIPGDISELITAALDELNAAVKEANKYSEKDYTAESYGVLKALLDKAATKNEKSHVLGMRYLTEDINTAVKALVKKPAQDSVKPGTAKPSTTTPNVKSQAQKNAENAMKQAKITKLTVKSKAKKKITVTWKKVSKANGYQVQVSTNKKFKKSKIILTKTTSKKKITIKKLKSKKTYFVRVRAYATYKDSNGKPQKVYSSWIKKTRKVKVK